MWVGAVIKVGTKPLYYENPMVSTSPTGYLSDGIQIEEIYIIDFFQGSYSTDASPVQVVPSPEGFMPAAICTMRSTLIMVNGTRIGSLWSN